MFLILLFNKIIKSKKEVCLITTSKTHFFVNKRLRDTRFNTELQLHTVMLNKLNKVVKSS